jgi:hypothetical protein
VAAKLVSSTHNCSATNSNTKRKCFFASRSIFREQVLISLRNSSQSIAAVQYSSQCAKIQLIDRFCAAATDKQSCKTVAQGMQPVIEHMHNDNNHSSNNAQLKQYQSIQMYMCICQSVFSILYLVCACMTDCCYHCYTLSNELASHGVVCLTVQQQRACKLQSYQCHCALLFFSLVLNSTDNIYD